MGGRASFSDFVEGCVRLFEDAAETLAAIKDETAIHAQCEKLDELENVFIHQCTAAIDAQAKRLGKSKTRRAINDVSRRVREISARAKHQIHKRALAEYITDRSVVTRQPEIQDIRMFRQWIEPIEVRLMRELISPEEALQEVRVIANDEKYPVKLRARILEELDPLALPPSEMDDYGETTRNKIPASNVVAYGSSSLSKHPGDLAVQTRTPVRREQIQNLRV